MSLSNQQDLKQLFALVSQGDEQAFRQLFSLYAPQIHPFIFKIVKSREVSEEIVQEIFLKIWIKRLSLTEIDHPNAWIYRIASNTAINYFKKQELDRRVLLEYGKNTASESLVTLDHLNAKELQALVSQAIEQLPPKRKLIYHLMRDQGLSRKEVANKLGLSENTVKNQVAKSMQFIQEFIKNKSGYYIPVIVFFKNYF